MKRLEDMIRTQGTALNADVLLVDSFLNNRVDYDLMADVGRAFADAARDMAVDLVVTIEASGIAPALMTAQALNVPLVIMKKSASRTLTEGILQKEVFSFTKNAAYQLTLKKKFIPSGARVLLIDDFYTTGSTAESCCEALREMKPAGLTVLVYAVRTPQEEIWRKGKRPYGSAGQ